MHTVMLSLIFVIFRYVSFLRLTGKKENLRKITSITPQHKNRAFVLSMSSIQEKIMSTWRRHPMQTENRTEKNPFFQNLSFLC